MDLREGEKNEITKGKVMRGYIAKRIIYALITLFVITTSNFVIFQILSPIDPVTMMVNPYFPPELKETLVKQFGLDQPLSTRYFKYIISMLTFNFGHSFVTRMPVATEILSRLANTLLLLGLAQMFTIMVGITVGVLAASRRGSKIDVLVMSSSIVAGGVPAYFVQIMVLLLFYYLFLSFGILVFPTSGKTSVPPPADPLAYVVDVAHHLVLPVFTLVITRFGYWALFTRNIMLDTLSQDFIVTARAKALNRRSVLFRHAFRVMLPSVATMIAMSIPGIITGSIITEILFSWPGMGTWYLSSMLSGDYPAVQALFFVFAVLMIGSNLVADLLYGYLDPRVSVGGRR